MKGEEDRLQISCVSWFELQYPRFRLNLHHSPNGGSRNQIEAAKLKKMGVRPGWPDLVLIHPESKNVVGFELKAGKNKQTDSQKEYESLFNNCLAGYHVIRSLEQFIYEVNKFMFYG